MVNRISDTMPYAGNISVQGTNSNRNSTSSSQDTGQTDEVSISQEARALEKNYAEKEKILAQTYASEADQLERDFEQEKAQLQQEYEQKKQSLGINIMA